MTLLLIILALAIGLYIGNKLSFDIDVQKTKKIQLLTNELVNNTRRVHTTISWTIIFLTTTFSLAINTTILVFMATSAFMAAMSLGVSLKPFMIIVAKNASITFLTPVTITNTTRVMAKRAYKFGYNLKVGAPLLPTFDNNDLNAYQMAFLKTYK